MKEYFGVENSVGVAYSQAVKVKDTVYISGQGPNTLECSAEEQVRQTLENVRSVLAEVGLDLNDVVKVTAILNYNYVTSQLFEKVYTEYFQSPYPVRTVVKSDIGFNVQNAVAVSNKPGDYGDGSSTRGSWHTIGCRCPLKYLAGLCNKNY